MFFELVNKSILQTSVILHTLRQIVFQGVTIRYTKDPEQGNDPLNKNEDRRRTESNSKAMSKESA